jgi:hypothetical protein
MSFKSHEKCEPKVTVRLWLQHCGPLQCGLKDPADGDSMFLRNFDNQLRPNSSNCRSGGNVTWLSRCLWWGRLSLRSHNSQIVRHLCYYRQLNTECLAFRTLALCMGDIGFKPPPNTKQSGWKFLLLSLSPSRQLFRYYLHSSCDFFITTSDILVSTKSVFKRAKNKLNI